MLAHLLRHICHTVHSRDAGSTMYAYLFPPPPPNPPPSLGRSPLQPVLPVTVACLLWLLDCTFCHLMPFLSRMQNSAHQCTDSGTHCSHIQQTLPDTAETVLPHLAWLYCRWNGWTQRIPCSSYIPQAAPATLRASCTLLVGLCLLSILKRPLPLHFYLLKPLLYALLLMLLALLVPS